MASSDGMDLTDIYYQDDFFDKRMHFKMIIAHGDDYLKPIVADEVTIERERKGSASKCTFTVFMDETLMFVEGNSVRIYLEDKIYWYGRIFEKTRTKEGKIKVTAYDMLRYFMSKDTITYSNKTATEIIKLVCQIVGVNTGEIADTKYKIPNRIEDNQSYLDMIYNALDETITNTKELYTLYCDNGRICLKNIRDMKSDLLITNETAEDYDYTSSIDKQTYNQIKLVKVDSETKKRDIYVVKDSANVKTWGFLQYFEEIQDSSVDGKQKANILAQLYNHKTKTLTFKGVYGEPTLIPGCLVPIHINLGDVTLNNYMMVDNLTYKMKQNHGNMDLQVVGGEFISGLVTSGSGSQAAERSNENKNKGGGGGASGTGKDWGHGITEAMLNGRLRGVLANKGNLYLRYANAYKINPALATAISMEETGNGTSHLATKQNNFFGMKNHNGKGFQTFGSIEAGIKGGISLLSIHYIHKGRKSIAQIQEEYAPLSDTPDNKEWQPNVKSIYRKIAGKNYDASVSGTGVGSDAEASKNMPVDPPKPAPSKNQPTAHMLEIIKTIKSQEGVRYVWGGASPKEGFDCSGLMKWGFETMHGVKIARVAADQANGGQPINQKDMRPGDLIFFATEGGKHVSHVAMYLNDPDWFFHAPHKGARVGYQHLSKYHYPIITIRRYA